MSRFRLVADSEVGDEVGAVFDWYEKEREGLGTEFLEEVRAAYDRIVDGPFKYRELRGGIRRALLRRFPYAVYFAVENEVVVVLAVLHASRDSEQWQKRRE